MSGFNFFDPFVLFCVVEALAVFALMVVSFGLSVHCAHVAWDGHVTAIVAHLEGETPSAASGSPLTQHV